MTDSPKDLTESVIAAGNLLEGERAGLKCIDYPIDLFMRLKTYTLSEADLIEVNRLQRRHMSTHTCGCPKPGAKKNRHALGPREFTLTYSPKWFDDVEARHNMSKAVDKLIKYNWREITVFRAVGEVGTNGLSHVHCYYELQGGKKITDKNFRRAWSYWDPSIKYGKGFQGGHHQEVKNTADFLGYIDKEIDTAWLDKSFPV